MANAQLTSYIKENLSKFSKEAIIQSLQGAGWSAVDISAAFMEFERPAPVVIEPAQKASFPESGEFSAKNSPTSGAVAPSYIPDKLASASDENQVSRMPQQDRAAVPQNRSDGLAQALPIQPTNTNATFLAQMEKRRREAEALNPQPISQGDVTISMGATQSSATTEGGIVGLLIKSGLVKNQQQANIVMIAFVVVALGVAYWLVF